MLTYLHVKNIALIKELEIDFDKGLNILTGETGAGKSIILGSINYVLGAKVKKDFIRRDSNEAMVECVFVPVQEENEKEMISKLFLEYGIDSDDEGIIVSRKTALNGRSVYRVNGLVVRREVVQKLSKLLIDIHSQHEHQSLLSPSRQLDLLDRYSGPKMTELLNLYKTCYLEYQTLLKSIDENLLDDDKRRREIAFLEFEIKEIEDAGLRALEDIELQKTYDRLNHSKEVLASISSLSTGLYDGGDISSIISKASSELDKFKEDSSLITNILETLLQVEDLLTMLHRDMNNYVEDMDDFEEELFHASSRLDTINQMKLKYGDSIENIFEYLEDKKSQHKSLIDFEETLIKTKKDIAMKKEELLALSLTIRKIRMEKGKHLGEEILESLNELNLENTSFEVKVSKQDTYTSKGMDKVEFLISTNVGEELKSLKEVASGGELSRIMLAIKSILATVDGVDTLIFDEIDTGISGITAQMVAEKMAKLSNERQLICITHLPQIASMARQHYVIEKNVINNETITSMIQLTDEKSIDELSRMLSGSLTSEAVVKTAREMKDYSKTLMNI